MYLLVTSDSDIILTGLSDYSTTRPKHFTVTSLQELLDKVNTPSIISFIKYVNLLSSL